MQELTSADVVVVIHVSAIQNLALGQSFVTNVRG